MTFAAARLTMVENQLRTFDVSAPAVLAAFGSVPREVFLPARLHALAYADRAVMLPGNPGRSMLAPMILARMMQAAEVSSSDHVLDVGCAAGYSSVIFGLIAASVVGIEADAALVSAAAAAAKTAGAGNVSFAAGGLAGGHAAKAPYSLIFLNGAAAGPPEGLAAQLKEAGRLVYIAGEGQAGRVTILRKSGDSFSSNGLFDASAPVLDGFARKAEFVF